MPSRRPAPRRPLPSGRHAALRSPVGASPAIAGLSRVAAVLAVGAFGVTALQATQQQHWSPVPLARVVAVSGPLLPAATAPRVGTHQAIHQSTRRPPAAQPVKPATKPAKATSSSTAAASSSHAHRAGAAKPAAKTQPHPQARPWLPSGTGMWIYQWSATNGGDQRSVVAQAHRAGLSTLYVRSGSSHDGLTPAATRQLLQATRHTGIDVVAWDFPTLWHPRRDAARLARAARLGRNVAAVAPDIETPSEGTFNAGWRVRTYLTALDRRLPKGVSILATVPWPSSYRIADYPYRAVAPHADAIVPMAYWYDNPPAMVANRSISYLRRFHKPVLPVGQGYDGKIDVPSLRHNHLGREVHRFFRTAHRHGVRAVSLWSWQAAPAKTWRALAHAKRLFDTKR